MQRYYDIVASELRNRELKDGLWARALAETGDYDPKARARYIKLRAEELCREEEEQRIAEQLRRKEEADSKVIEEMRRLEEVEKREFLEKSKDAPSLGRVFVVLSLGFVALAVIVLLMSRFF